MVKVHAITVHISNHTIYCDHRHSRGRVAHNIPIQAAYIFTYVQ